MELVEFDLYNALVQASCAQAFESVHAEAELVKTSASMHSTPRGLRRTYHLYSRLRA
jgi:hypothetical protein